MSRILTLNIGASKATLAEYSLGGKRNLTLTAYGSADLQTVDVNDAMSISASLPPVISQIMREAGIRPAPVVVSLGGQMVFPRFAKFPAVGDKAKLEQPSSSSTTRSSRTCRSRSTRSSATTSSSARRRTATWRR